MLPLAPAATTGDPLSPAGSARVLASVLLLLLDALRVPGLHAFCAPLLLLAAEPGLLLRGLLVLVPLLVRLPPSFVLAGVRPFPPPALVAAAACASCVSALLLAAPASVVSCMAVDGTTRYTVEGWGAAGLTSNTRQHTPDCSSSRTTGGAAAAARAKGCHTQSESDAASCWDEAGCWCKV